jgi:hypothetical protein
LVACAAGLLVIVGVVTFALLANRTPSLIPFEGDGFSVGIPDELQTWHHDHMDSLPPEWNQGDTSFDKWTSPESPQLFLSLSELEQYGTLDGLVVEVRTAVHAEDTEVKEEGRSLPNASSWVITGLRPIAGQNGLVPFRIYGIVTNGRAFAIYSAGVSGPAVDAMAASLTVGN